MPGKRGKTGKTGKTGPGLNARAFGAILDGVRDGVLVVDRRRRVVLLNRAAETLTGVPRAEAVGRPCCEVFGDSVCGERCSLRRVVETGEPAAGRQIEVRGPEGAEVRVEVTAEALRDRSGRVTGGAAFLRDASAPDELRRELRGERCLGDVVARSRAMREVLTVLPRIATSGATVLIEGESGTGKELIARALHGMSPRAGRPFVVVNCAALPDTLLEAVLFGGAAGAPRDAGRGRRGRFEVAHGGTLFLDEIGDVSPALQVRLLRVLQEKEYQPPGTSRTARADVRLLAATERDLESLVVEGGFRQDLFYRVNVVRIKLPPLRQRRTDIPALLEHFIGRLNLREGREIAGLERAAVGALMDYDWPGNVRELESVLEHAFVLCPGRKIRREHLPEKLRGAAAGAGGPEGDTLAELEAWAIAGALERCGGRKGEAAAQLGIDPSTLWRKLRRLGAGEPEAGNG
ncbi:MAG: sigma-54 interaction domain-containing protein [Planctomycetota bacterium]|jgi:PAS domain S-box-containing protein